MLSFNDIKEKIHTTSEKNSQLTVEHKAIISHLKQTKDELETLTKNIDYVTDPILLNQLIFQLKAAEVRYQYWFCMAREQNITTRLSIE